MRLELTNTGFAIRRLSRLATRADLERKERFELSKRVWKTHMLPATSLPRRFGTPGRTRTRNLDVRSVALFQLSYRSKKHCRLLICDCRFDSALKDQSEIGNWNLAMNVVVGEDRVELSPRVPRTRMLALHHTPIELVRQVRLELTIPCLRGRCLDPIWLLTHGGTERTRTVIDLIDNQVPHLSATVPL